MPGEFEPHERTLLGWPCRVSLWGDRLDAMKRDMVVFATTIAEFEPVTIYAESTAAADEARAMLDTADRPFHPITVEVLPLDDTWLRDMGPIVVKDTDTGERAVVDFRFNGHGGRFVPHDADDAVASTLALRWGWPLHTSEMVLEGGAIAVDGAGTLVTTTQCLMHPNRNPSMSRTAMELEMSRLLGIERFIWVPYSVDDRDTDGHIDQTFVFTRPGHALVQTCDNADDPEHERLAISLRWLRDEMEVTEIPTLPYIQTDDGPMHASPLNLYLCNGGVIVPVTGHPSDDEQVAIIAACFPERRTTTVPGVNVAAGGGSIHCSSQQVPA
jgi:agmatine deiminase